MQQNPKIPLVLDEDGKLIIPPVLNEDGNPIVQTPVNTGRATGAGPNVGATPVGGRAQFQSMNSIPEQKPYFVDRTIQRLNTSVIPEVSEAAHSFGNYITDPNNRFFKDENSFGRSIEDAMRGYIAGTIGTQGDIVSGSATPMNLGMMAAGGAEGIAAKAGFNELMPVFTGVRRLASVPPVIQGAIDLFGSDKSAGERLGGLGNMAMGGLGVAMPGFRPGEAPNTAFDLERRATPHLMGEGANPPVNWQEAVQRASEILGTDASTLSPKTILGRLMTLPPDTEVGYLANTVGRMMRSGEAMSLSGMANELSNSRRVGIHKADVDNALLEDTARAGLLDENGNVIDNRQKPNIPITRQVGSSKSASNFGTTKDIYGNDIPNVESEADNLRRRIVNLENNSNLSIMGKAQLGSLKNQLNQLSGNNAAPGQNIPAAAQTMGPRQPTPLGGNNPPPQNITPPPPNASKSTLLDWYQNASSVFKTLTSSIDLSAFRQASNFRFHPEYYKNIVTMVKAMGSDQAVADIRNAIESSSSGYFTKAIQKPGGRMVSMAEDAGLDLSDHSVNERFASKWFSNLGGRFNPIGMSKRAFEGYILKMRADMFEKLYGEIEASGRGSFKNAQDVAKVVNRGTGTASLGNLEHSKAAMTALNETMFAPRYNVSRVQTWTKVLDPKTYTSVDPVVRRETIKSLLSVVGSGVAMGQLARTMGAEISYDPSNSDFLKMRFGNTRLDPFAGLQQYPVAVLKTMVPQMFGGGYSTSSTSGRTSDLMNPKYGGSTRLDMGINFGRSKLAPIPGMIVDWMAGPQYDGTPYDAKVSLAQHITPMVLQDLYDIYKEDPKLIPPLLLPAILGMGIQTYGR